MKKEEEDARLLDEQEEQLSSPVPPKQTHRPADVQSSHSPRDQRGCLDSCSGAPRGHTPGNNHSRKGGKLQRMRPTKPRGRRLLSCTTRLLAISRVTGSFGPRGDHPPPLDVTGPCGSTFSSSPKLGKCSWSPTNDVPTTVRRISNPCNVPFSDELQEARAYWEL